MSRKIVILECNNESHPAICFNLEVARCETRIVFDENEAINLMEIAQHTEERFDCLLVNNPFLNVDISHLVEQGQRIGTDIPIVFVKQSEALKGIVASLASQYPAMSIHFSEPTQVAELVLKLPTVHKTNSDDSSNSERRRKTGRR